MIRHYKPPELKPFITKDESNSLKLNEKVIKMIRNSDNPHIVIITGKYRLGKSTTLNNIICGCKTGMTFIPREQIFKADRGITNITKGCDIYGPIKLSELRKRNCLESIEGNADIFLVDSEGLDSIDGTTDMLYPGIITLLLLASTKIQFNNKVPDKNELNSVCLMDEISDMMLSTKPSIIFYSSLDDVKSKEDEDKFSSDLFKSINKGLNGKIEDVTNCIKTVVGPFREESVDEDDIKLNLYWDSLRKTVDFFTRDIQKRGDQSGENLSKLILDMFDSFKDLREIPNRLDDDFTAKIRNFAIKKFREDLTTAKDDVKELIKYYIDLQIDIIKNENDEAKTLIINTYGETRFQKIRNVICDAIENDLNSGSREIIDFALNLFEDHVKSEEFINSITKDNIAEIELIQPDQDIDQASIKDESIENVIKTRIADLDETIYKYMKEETKYSLLFKSKEKIVNKMVELSNWHIIYNRRIIQIEYDIAKAYSEQMDACKFRENFEQEVMKPEELEALTQYALIYNYFHKYENNQGRVNYVKKQIMAICEEQFKKLDRTKLPSKFTLLLKIAAALITGTAGTLLAVLL